jgi:hypothetical protein
LTHWKGRSLHVVGLLGTTDIEEDWWIATDFLVWRELLSGANSARWLSGTDLKKPMDVILGDPYADRLKFSLSIDGIIVLPTPLELVLDFLEALHNVGQSAADDDVVVVVICGHAEPGSGHVCVGGGPNPITLLSKRVLEKALRNLSVAKDCLFVVSTACYSGTWRSPHWTLLAAAEEDQESDAMRKSESNECRGGFFTFAVLAEMADEQGLAVPLCEEVDLGDSDIALLDDIDIPMRHPQIPGNLRDSVARRVLQTPRRSLFDAWSFMQNLRDRVGGVYKYTTFVVDPASNVPLEFPVRLFDQSFLDRFCIIGPSPPDIITSATESSISEPSEASDDELAPLNPIDAEELMRLATAYKAVNYPATGSNIPAILDSSKLVSGASLSVPLQRKLLSRLRYHARACRRAAAIAEFLEWPVAEPVESWRRKTGLTQIKEAQQAGAKLMDAFVIATADGAWVGEGRPLWRMLGPGEWLAEAWAAAGKPTIGDESWAAALSYGDDKAGSSF